MLLKILGIIFSYTGSVPIGFYRIVADRHQIQLGNIISFCLPNKIAQVGVSRGYLNKGQCKNGSEPLMKEVIAVPSDHIVLTNDQIIVTHKHMTTVYFAPTDIKDKHHLLVKRFIVNGNYRTAGYWVYGFGSPRYSWDSRYYGAIRKSDVMHILMPLWLW